MDHTVHLHNARAAPRRSPGPFPGGAARRGAAGRGFASESLLARHISRFQKYLCEARLKQTTAQNKTKPWPNLRKKMGWKVELQCGRFFNLRVENMFLSNSLWSLLKPLPAPDRLAPLRTKSLSTARCVEVDVMWQKTPPWAQTSRDFEEKPLPLYLHIKNSQDCGLLYMLTPTHSY